MMINRSDMKWPIIHLLHVPTQEKLFRELTARGFRYSYGWGEHDAVGYPYLNVYSADNLTFYSDPQPQFAVMNSPRQFLSYLDRMLK